MAAYVSRRVEVARQKVAEWGDPDVPCFGDLDEALRAVEADAVVLVTPPEVHREQTLAAFEHGCDVLCEKPLSEVMAETVELVGVAERSGRQLMVGMNFRYLHTSQAIRRMVLTEELGAPGFGHFAYIRNRDGRRADLNKYPLMMVQPMLLEQSVHHLDLLRYCYARDVEAVSADTWRPSWSTYADDCCVSVLLRFAGGLRANYIGTWTSGWNHFCFEWRTDFPGGALIQKKQFSDLYLAKLEPGLALTGRNFKTEDSEAEPLLPVPLPPLEDFVDDTRGLLDEFINAVEGKAPLVTSARDHLKTLGLVFACIEAAETGKLVILCDFYRRQGIPDRWID
jgi:predicted dehydrogenase